MLLPTLLICFIVHFEYSNGQSFDLRMPGVIPNQGEQYLCISLKINSTKDLSIISFIPKASKMRVHHMLLYGCAQPGRPEPVWDCREMVKSNNQKPMFPTGRVCNSFQRVIYAWAMDAPDLHLPAGVGFKVGGSTDNQYLVLQVHYLRALDDADSSGVSVITTTEKMPKSAGIFFMASNGVLKANSVEKFEMACSINENIEIHPFAFRVHTHEHGRIVSGYLIRDGVWKSIGKKNPQLPQMFYPIDDSKMILKSNDIVASRCTMINDGDHDVFIGPRAENEMCNYYLMYWVNGDTVMSQSTCFFDGTTSLLLVA